MDPISTPRRRPSKPRLSWAMQPVRRRGGARAGGFPGADVILGQLESGPARLRTGFLPEGRAPVRAGAAIFDGETAERPCGIVTSGGFGPSADRPIAMGYVPAMLATPGSRVLRRSARQAPPPDVTAMPFVPIPTNAAAKPPETEHASHDQIHRRTRMAETRRRHRNRRHPRRTPLHSSAISCSSTCLS